jgi:glucose/arabinose dehydrogenase
MLSPSALAAQLGLESVVSGLNRPVFVTSLPGDLERLFILEQHTGQVKILNLNSGVVDGSPFLIIDNLATRSEQGLLGLAFDPLYRENGYFYVNVTISPSDTTEIRRYQVSPDDPNRAIPESETLIMRYAQPFRNHNGGWIGFGPDGYLYIASGDGGSGNDPGNRAQDLTDQKLGKILRIDVSEDQFPNDDSRFYTIPADNPFVGLAGDDEIWAYGLRNPWRCSFDRQTGDFWIADVGQGQREEINWQPGDSIGGENYGWRIMEGTRCNRAGDALPCNDPSLVLPIHEYPHTGAPNGGFSITGGYVYRGPIRALAGAYFFADFVSEQIWSIRYEEGAVTELVNWTDKWVTGQGRVGEISSFGEDALGHLYIVDLSGEIFRVICSGELAGDFDNDCDVDVDDVALLVSQWGLLETDAAWDPMFNLVSSDNEIIDQQDLEALLGDWVGETETITTDAPSAPKRSR